MIQRKQSIWLLLSAACILLGFIFPYGQTAAGSPPLWLSAKTDLPTTIISICSAVLAAFTIFQFKNRSLQIKLCAGVIFLNIVLMAWEIFHTYFSAGENIMIIGLSGTTLFIGIIIPVISIFFTWLAWKGIQHDEKLIRDTDRLR